MDVDVGLVVVDARVKVVTKVEPGGVVVDKAVVNVGLDVKGGKFDVSGSKIVVEVGNVSVVVGGVSGSEFVEAVDVVMDLVVVDA